MPLPSLRLALGAALLALATATAHAAPTAPRGRIDREGTFPCWPPGAVGERTCEISGAIWTRRGLVVATDKPLEGGHFSHVWRTSLPGGPVTRRAELRAPAFLASTKIEGLASDPAGDWCFATTSFSWFVPDAPAQADSWNVLVAWREGAPEAAHIVEPTVRGGVTSSASLIPRMRAALATASSPEGPAWFKIEGLAVLPGQRLAFGVRAIGPSHVEKTMVGVVIAARYAVCRGRVRIVGRFRKIVDWEPSALVGRPAGVSGLEYDAASHRLLLLTSFEAERASTPDDLDGWAWVLPDAERCRGRAPALVRDATGAPLRFGHKPEAITKVGPQRYLVIHDDDRVLGAPPGTASAGGEVPRARHEARYAYLRLCCPR